MKRAVKSDRPVVRPVKHIELSEEKIRLRTLLLVILIVIALASFGYGINTLFSAEPGLQEITVLSPGGLNCGDDFTFYYNIGANGNSATAEFKAVRTLYSQAAVDAYQLFNADMEFDDCRNLWYINNHVNEEIAIAPALYDAFVLLEESGMRYHYLAPMYEMYFSLFHCEHDYETVDYDPYINEDLRQFYEETAFFTNDSDAIALELLGNNTIRLHVSDAYLSFAEENSITRFIDLFWLKNAFAADYIADILLENGYSSGTLISDDGFIRSLDDGTGNEYAFVFSHRDGAVVSDLFTKNFSGTVSIVYLRDYPLSDGSGYYVYEDGEIRSPFVDTADGLCKSSIPELAAFSTTLSCAETALKVAPIYISDTFDEDAIQALIREDITSYYFIDNELRYTGTEYSCMVKYHEKTLSN